MIKQITINSVLTCAFALVVATAQTSRAVTIDDFNINEGHFNQSITFSGTTIGEDASSTADRVTTDGPLEGLGHQRLFLVHDATETPFRLRHISGGASPANNVVIPTTSGVDGKIGFYLKTTNTGWETSINLDGSGNSIAEMAGSMSLPIIADGEWHLYEWDLDSTEDWGPVPGIGGGFGGALPDRATNTIDSIYFRDLDGSPGPTAEIFLDFVAWNPNGSIADLLGDPCVDTPGVLVIGPISTNSSQVRITGVDANASQVTVYQDSGSGMVSIGSTNANLVEGNNFLTIEGLIKDAKVIATQTMNGQESCLVPENALYVGGGANPSVRVAVTIRETSDTGPVGASATDTSSANLHFIGASTLAGLAPSDALILFPSNEWQTVTIGGNSSISETANAVGTPAAGTTYTAGNSVAIQVLPFKTVGASRVYAETPVSSDYVSSGENFSVNWTWDAVSGADGYRLVRDVNGLGFLESIDVTENSLNDTDNNAWVSVEASANVVGTPTAGTTYTAGQSVAIQVIPFKTVNGSRVYATTPANSDYISSGEDFSVNWTWNAVSGANGYRVLRDLGGAGFLEGIDVTGNSLNDTDSNAWGTDIQTTPTGGPLSPSVQWNGPAGSVGTTNGPQTPWGILESLNFAIDSDTGPFNIYIDNIQNGTNVFQTFETEPSGTQGYAFQAPSFSGSTSANILSSPNLGMITNITADTGENSLNIQFQWSSTAPSRWLRLTSSAAGTAANPLVDLSQPISFRILLLPVGSELEPPAQPPTIAFSLNGDQLTLTWTGTFNLQSKDNINDAEWTNVGVDTSPYVTTVTGAAKFYRLQGPTP